MPIDTLAVSVSDLVKSYRSPVETVHVLDRVDLDVGAGELICITGASGSGKSTLLSVLAGLEESDSGSVRVLGTDLSKATSAERAFLRLTSMGIIFQDYNLIPDFTVLENIEVVLRATGLRKDDAREQSMAALRSVGVDRLFNRFPKEISGGQAQRVGIARSIAGGKRLILADEPTGALDHVNSTALFELLAELAGSGYAIVLCTHDLQAKRYASDVAELRAGKLMWST